MIKSNWIGEENLFAFLLIISNAVSYDFEPQDWKAIQFGLSESNAEKDIWFEYVLPGKSDVELQLAKEAGTALILYKFLLPDELENNYDFLVYLMQDFKVTHSNFNPHPF